MEIELNAKEKSFLSRLKNSVTNEKKVLTVGFALFLTLSIATAIWYMNPTITGYAVYKVKSNQPNVTILENLINQTLVTEESNITFERLIKIDSNKNQQYTIFYLTHKYDNESDSCVDFENDCEINYFIGDRWGYGELPYQELINGETYLLPKGINTITVYTYCKRNSCPQEITIEVTLFKKENN